MTIVKNETAKKLMVVVAAATLGFAGIQKASAVSLATWNFENPPDPIAVNNSPAPTTGSGTASSIGMNIYPTPNIGVTTDDVLAGAAADTGTNGLADLSQIWRVRAQAGANGPANGWSSLAPIGTQGAIFASPTPAGTTSVNVSFDWYATNQGEAKMYLAYTTNGTTWTDVPVTMPVADTVGTGGAGVLVNAASPNTVTGSYVYGGNGGQNWFPNLTATITDPNLAGNPNFAIEMVNASTGADCVAIKSGTPLNNNSGNWRFDNLSVSAVPEPASLSVLGLAGLGLLQRRNRNKSA